LGSLVPKRAMPLAADAIVSAFVGAGVLPYSYIRLAILGVHILCGLMCVLAGVGAMLSKKGREPHVRFGSIYYWALFAVFVSTTILATFEWSQDYYLFILGALSFGAASFGRAARRQQWPGWVTTHIVGMGLSYILLLTAFYVDNGPELPLWKELPRITDWLLPAALGIPLVVRTVRRYRDAPFKVNAVANLD
jgi:hypothetical protein